MHKQRIALFVIALLGIVGTFLPWYTLGMDVPASGAQGGQQVPDSLLQALRSDLEKSGWTCSSPPTGGLQARFTVSGTVGDGWITLGLYVPAVLMALIPGRGWWKKSWRGGWFFAYAIPSLLASAAGIYDWVNFYRAQPGLYSNPNFELVQKLYNASISLSVGPGLYLTAGAGVVLVILAFLLRGPAQPAHGKSVPEGDAAH